MTYAALGHPPPRPFAEGAAELPPVAATAVFRRGAIEANCEYSLANVRIRQERRIDGVRPMSAFPPTATG
jgi:uncharacterized membrane-anchored protein